MQFEKWLIFLLRAIKVSVPVINHPHKCWTSDLRSDSFTGDHTIRISSGTVIALIRLSSVTSAALLPSLVPWSCTDVVSVGVWIRLELFLSSFYQFNWQACLHSSHMCFSSWVSPVSQGFMERWISDDFQLPSWIYYTLHCKDFNGDGGRQIFIH